MFRGRVATLVACVLFVQTTGASAIPSHRAPTAYDTLHLMAPGIAPAPLRVRVLLPANYRTGPNRRWPVLYLNDGQDAEAVDLVDTLGRLTRAGGIRAPVVVAIDAPPDRLGAYGFSDRANARDIRVDTAHGIVGANANAYARWLTGTLVPIIDARYRTQAAPAGRSLLGWSLGAVSAFDIGWQYPELFARVGAFSPSFWLAADRSTAASSQRTRVAQTRVAAASSLPCVSYFMAVGTEEETDDRDADGVNDALDDVNDLVDGWAAGRPPLAGLRQRGVRVESADSPLKTLTLAPTATLYVLPAGVHRAASWSRMLPAFLHWAFSPSSRAPQCPKASAVLPKVEAINQFNAG